MFSSWRGWLTQMTRRTPARRRSGTRPARARLDVESLEDRLAPATFIVTTAGDAVVKPTLIAGTTYSAPTLRGAIEMADATNPAPAKANTIIFEIPGNKVQTIMVGNATKGAALPEIKTFPLMINAYPPKNGGVVIAKYANQVIVLNGSQANLGSNGLTISAGKSVVQGLVINSFKRNPNAPEGQEGGNGIVLMTKGSNRIQGNVIGTDYTGMKTTDAQGNPLANQGFGIFINMSPDNLIGGRNTNIVVPPRNILSNNLAGIQISGVQSTGNNIRGNLIGTDAKGAGALPNTNGVVINGAPNNIVGGDVNGDRNIISGNTSNGVQITGADAKGNKVQGNYVGVQLDGKTKQPNARGVQIAGGATGNTVGGTTAGARNILSGNTLFGVEITGNGTNGNFVQGNYIGTNYKGSTAVPNRAGVVVTQGASYNQIGGKIGTTGIASQLAPGTGAANVISGNTNGAGVRITGGEYNTVQGNLIGVAVDGATKLPNLVGVYLDTTQHATVGGTAANLRNIISGNTTNGVNISGSVNNVDNTFVDSIYNTVRGNYIGTDFTGTKGAGNGSNGIYINNASNNTIGGTAAGSGNVISDNATNGVNISGAESVRNRILGNNIGTSVTDSKGKTTSLPNGNDGVLIEQGALRNTVANSLIANNKAAGIQDLNPVLSNAFTQNSITNNGALGIDDAAPGVTNISLPVLTVSPISNNSITITGSLGGSAPNATMTIEFFVNTAADKSGFGQGAVYIGSTTAQTDAKGNSVKNFSITVSINQKDIAGNPVTIATGNFISATATLPATKGATQFGTSEFSKSVVVPKPKQVGQAYQTSTTVVSSGSTSSTWTYGQSQTLTATVTDLTSGGGTPTGQVAFVDNGTLLGTAPLNSAGVATLTSTGVLGGADVISGEYDGEGQYLASTGTYNETVTPAPLTITAANQTMVYGAALPDLSLSYNGFVNGDTAASLTTQPTLITTASASSPVGNYAITASGAVDSNYTIVYVAGTLSVTPATLTITASDQSTTYGSTLPGLTASYKGFVNDDTAASLTAAPSLTTTATSSSPVGTYAITASGAVDPNYTIVYVAGTLSVTPAALTITANDQSMGYGASVPTLTASYSGFVNGDTAASLTSLPSLTTTATSASPVGSYAITAGGAVDSNYTIDYVSGTLSVTAATLTITANSQSTTYGSSLPGQTASYKGFVNGDTAASLTSAPSLTTTASSSSPVGSYAITASGAVDPNYTIVYVAGTLTVTPAALTITANNQSMGYGAAMPTLTASYSGFVNGDTPASLTSPPSLTTTATSASPVGTYAITASGAVDPNYTIKYVPGTLTVTQAATVTGLGQAPSTSVFGQTVYFAADVLPALGGSGVPTGSVTFEYLLSNGAVVTLGTEPLGSTGFAYFSTALLTPGSYTIMAIYEGDGNFTGSDSNQTTLAVSPAQTTISLSASATQAVSGQAINFTTTLATVAPGAFVVPPTGTITFYDTYNGVTTQVVVLTLGGPPAMTPAFTQVGTHVIIAVYSGDGNFDGSVSSPITITILPSS
jgi:hypothetical protein